MIKQYPELTKGHAKEVIEGNIKTLVDEGNDTNVAIGIAATFARVCFKNDHPETSAFPSYLSPGNIMKSFGEGEAENE